MTNAHTVTRDDITSALQHAFEPLPYAHALWEGGAASFERVDDWSDIDVQVIVDDDRVADAFAVTEAALNALSPIDLIFELPQPSWHGHAQRFYRLQGASPFHVVDFVVMSLSNTHRFSEPEIHGRAKVYFDKQSLLHTEPIDVAAFAHKLRTEKVHSLRAMFDVFVPFVQKEINRGNSIEALAFYQSLVLRPLVELLRIQHAPMHHNFHTRYIHYELPSEIVKRLEPLFFVGAVNELPAKQAEARRLFDETFTAITTASVQSR